MKESRHYCKGCPEIAKHFSYCDYRCSIKGEVKIKPKKINQWEIKRCLENNIGIRISQDKISIYQREIKSKIN